MQDGRNSTLPQLHSLGLLVLLLLLLLYLHQDARTCFGCSHRITPRPQNRQRCVLTVSCGSAHMAVEQGVNDDGMEFEVNTQNANMCSVPVSVSFDAQNNAKCNAMTGTSMIVEQPVEYKNKSFALDPNSLELNTNFNIKLLGAVSWMKFHRNGECLS